MDLDMFYLKPTADYIKSAVGLIYSNSQRP